MHPVSIMCHGHAHRRHMGRHQSSIQGELDETHGPCSDASTCSCAQDGACAQMPRRAHVPKTAGGATGGTLAHERAATELGRQGSLLLCMRTMPTTARALQQAAHPCLNAQNEREDGGRVVERQPLGVHLEGDRISHLP